MQSKMTYLTAGALLTLSVILANIVLLQQNVAADGATATSLSSRSTELESVNNVQADEEQSPSNPQENINSQISEPTSIPTATPILAEAIIEQQISVTAMRSQFLDKWLASLPESGWLFTAVLYERDPGDYGTLENGTPIPNQYILESWDYINEFGIVTMQVGIMKNLDGNIVQTAIFRDGIWQNFSQQTSYEAPPPQHPISYLQQVSMEPVEINTLDNSDTVNNSPKIAEFVLHETNSPLRLDDINAVSVGSRRVETYDIETGKPLRVDEFILLEDGSEHYLGGFEYLSMEPVSELPDEVFQILDMDIIASEEAGQ